MADNITQVTIGLKENIIKLVNNNKLDQAKRLLQQYAAMANDDIDVYSIKSVIAIQEGMLDEAKTYLNEGLSREGDNFDFLFNLAYIYKIEQDLSAAASLYLRLSNGNYDEAKRKLALEAYGMIQPQLPLGELQRKLKVAFFVKSGMDSFIKDIIANLSQDFEINKIVVTDLQQIDQHALWADICWFEWCDELVIYASKQPWAESQKIVCRLHSYEAFIEFIQHVNWVNIDRVIFVAEHIRDYVLQQVPTLEPTKTIVVPNGIDLNRYNFKERKPGYNIAYVGYINYKKGPMLLLHTFKAIYDADHRYKLYIAGQFQDGRYVLYFQQMIKALGLENNVFFEGWQDNISEWLEDKNYILSTSVLEGNPLGIMEAMARGIKPLIHNFVGSGTQFKNYVWNTISDCIRMLKNPSYNSLEYREFIKNNYALNQQINLLKALLQDVFSGTEENMGQYYKEQFEVNSDHIANTENLFNYLLNKNDEQTYMYYIQEWVAKSNLPIEYQIKYYYSNLYRNMTNYSRFKYMSEKPYEKIDNVANKIMTELYPVYFRNKKKKQLPISNKKKVLFLLHGLDYNQIVTQFYVDLIKASKNPNFEYHILSVLDKSEFKNADFSLEVLKQANINYYIPQSNQFDERIKEFYSYIAKLQPDIAMFQSFYFAPPIILLYPLLQKICKCTGRFVHQQAEPYFDRQIDFLSHYITEDKSVAGKELFDFPWPIKTHVIDKNYDIHAKFGIDKQQKIVVSLARDMYFRNNKLFWDFIIKMVTEISNVTYAVFGPAYDEDYKQYIPESLIHEKKIVLCGFDLEAAAYIKSCDFFLNTFPMGGGSSLQEAYYARLPIITFIQAQGDSVDLEGNSYLIPQIWYKNAGDIFPQHGDLSGLFDFTKRLICDEQFENYIQSKRKFAIEDMTYTAFAEKLEEYLVKKINC